MPMPRLFTAPWLGPTLIAAVAWLAIITTTDPAGNYPGMPEGPGLTVDEVFNVEQGVYLVEAIRNYGLAILDPRSIREIFDEQSYLPDHPPLGRLWLGLHHHAAWWFAPPADPNGLTVTACARTGSATAFALTILLVGWFAGAHYGPMSSWLAAAFLLLMPRVWGHAHLASLETMTNLTCTAAVLAVAHGWNQPTRPTIRSALLAGVLLGLAFLTKIQAILLPLPIICWTIWRWRKESWRPIAIWSVTAALVFLIGWPWLWLDPLNHVQEYFARTADRATLSVWYFGEKYVDKDVPWHYPWVIFATTLPLATLLTGGYAISHLGTGANDSEAARERSAQWLLMANVAFPLIVFSLPRVAVYDCERLFLTVFPFWSLLAARGTTLLLAKCRPGGQRSLGVALISLVLVAQLVNLCFYQPCYLSYYNLLVVESAGAENLGLETTYWGDSLTRDLLEDAVRQLPAGSTLHISPVVHPIQLNDLLRQSPILRQHQLQLASYLGKPQPGDYLLLFRRRADLPDELRFGPENAKLLAETRRHSVQLAGLYQFSSSP